MTNEQQDPVPAELAEIWRNANHRRSQDLRWWIIRIFSRHRPFKSPAAETRRRLRETLLASTDSSLAPRQPEITGGQSG